MQENTEILGDPSLHWTNHAIGYVIIKGVSLFVWSALARRSFEEGQ